MMSTPDQWQNQLQVWVRQACTAEVQAEKPGNVSPGHSFHDASVDDFLRSAAAVAAIIADSRRQGVGPTVLSAVQATNQAVGHNTNLGIILLLTPLAAVEQKMSLVAGIHEVLGGLTVNDSVTVYQAIAEAAPGGLGKADQQDISAAPTLDLKSCMALAADRDLIAAQYANSFPHVLKEGLAWLQESLQWSSHTDRQLAWIALKLLAQYGDSLIERKCGRAVSEQVRDRAAEVLTAGWPFSPTSHSIYEEFDRFLRDEQHRHNPGTTADLIAAIVFAGLREGICRFDEATAQIYPFKE